MESAIEIIQLIEAVCVGLAAIGGGAAIVVKVVHSLNEQHDNKEKYDGYDARIIELSNKVDELERKHDAKIEAMKDEVKTDLGTILGEYQSATDAKLQQISSELCMLSYCVGATLDGLKQLNCNGKVTEAKEAMDKHLNQQAHGEI